MSTEEERDEEHSPNAFEAAGQHSQLSLVQEFWLFIVENKAWWLVPILFVLLLVGLLAVFSSTAPVPFIYTFY